MADTKYSYVSLKRTEVEEAAGIVLLATDMLMLTSNKQEGRAGSDLRRTCGDMRANVKPYIVNNQIAEKLLNCFVQAQLSGATLDEFDKIRLVVLAETPKSLVAVLLQQATGMYCLQQMSIVLVNIVFVSRDDVEAMQIRMNEAFEQSEEYAADAMAQMTWRALVALHSSVIYYLFQTARPLPRMLAFEFAAPRPTLVLSYRLYYDATHADELRNENKVVHPAFAPRLGRALAP